MSQTSLDDLKALNRSLELVFIPTLIIGLIIIFSEVVVGSQQLSFFISGIIVMFSVTLSFMWISSIDKEEIVVLLRLKGDILSLAKGDESIRLIVKNFIKTTYRVVLYSSVSLLMFQVSFYSTLEMQYSITEIVLASIGIVTILHFLPLQLRVQKLRSQSHKLIKDSNRSNVQSHLLMNESKVYEELHGEEYRLLMRTVAINSEVINSENEFLQNTETDPNITLLRYMLPVICSLFLSFPLDNIINLLMDVI